MYFSFSFDFCLHYASIEHLQVSSMEEDFIFVFVFIFSTRPLGHKYVYGFCSLQFYLILI